jgi:hypothetical protein
LEVRFAKRRQGVASPPANQIRFRVAMRRTRIMIALTVFVGTFLTFAPEALARASAGEGWFGETTDPDITSAMFIVIAFFPTLILVLTLIQWRLDKRKHARMDAAKAREANADWRGGW